MSLATIRAALEAAAVVALGDGFSIAWENHPFTPVAGVPYAQVTLLPAQPVNPEIGQTFIESGIFQINLFYPKGPGSAAATTKAQAIRTAFYYGRTLSSGGINVIIFVTPEIGVARPDNDLFMIPVRVRWRAFVQN